MSLTPEDIAKRRGLITGSRIAKVVGLSPFGGPIDVYRELVEDHQQADSPQLRRGRHLELAILSWYAEDTGAKLTYPGTLTHPRHGRIGATVDALKNENEAVVEAKSVHFSHAQEWGESGTDDIPQGYIAQAQIEMGVCGLAQADVPALFGGDELRIYCVRFDPELFGMLVEAGEKFLRDHVDPKRPPPIDGSEGYGEYFKARFPKETRPEPIPATPEAERWAQALFAAKGMLEEAEKLEKEAKQHLQQMIGEAAGMKGSNWSISWKKTKDGSKVDYEALAKALSPPPDLISKFLKTTNGYRVFRASKKASK